MNDFIVTYIYGKIIAGGKKIRALLIARLKMHKFIQKKLFFAWMALWDH